MPHDWSIELDPTTGAGTSTPGPASSRAASAGTARRSRCRASAAGKRISVEFDGVYMDSIVYFNGQQVGSHPYGYTGFAVDLTDARAHRRRDRRTCSPSRCSNQLPSSRWYSGSGIYRHVHLVVTDPVHVARHGMFVTTPDVESTIDDGYADVHVDTKVVDEGGDERPRHQPRAATAQRQAVVGQGDAAARADHRACATRTCGRSRTRTSTRCDTELSVARQGGRQRRPRRFGIRWFRIDPNEGFSLNGEYHKIQGVDLHHDLGALGAAVNRDALVRQMRIMKSMGVNALRTSHNPPSPEMIEVCEELGIVMMVEAFDTWRTPKRAVRLRPLLRRQQRRRHQGDGQRGQELAGGDHVVDRQRDPGLDVATAGSRSPSG